MGGFLRRMLIAFDRGDMAKVPFSDDIYVREPPADAAQCARPVAALAPFLSFDPDPYIVVGEDGRLSWIIDAFTSSDTYPYASHSNLERRSGQLHAQQRQGSDRCL